MGSRGLRFVVGIGMILGTVSIGFAASRPAELGRWAIGGGLLAASCVMAIAVGELADALRGLEGVGNRRNVPPEPIRADTFAGSLPGAREPVTARDPSVPDAITGAGSPPSTFDPGELAGLRSRLEASKAANDPNGAMDARELILGRLSAEEREGFDRDLVKWMLAALMRRMRGGTVSVEVVELAGRIAETFANRVEGASVRASLPTLRRSAGLCPRCAKPYVGVEEACAECLKTAVAPTATTPSNGSTPSTPSAEEIDEVFRVDPEARPEDDPFDHPTDAD